MTDIPASDDNVVQPRRRPFCGYRWYEEPGEGEMPDHLSQITRECVLVWPHDGAPHQWERS